MAWHAVYRLSDGVLRGATGNINQVPEASELASRGLAVKTFGDRPVDMDWNPATLEYDIPIVRHEAIQTVQFWLRFTRQERIGIRTATDDNVQDWLFLLSHADVIRADRPEIVQGLTYLAQNGFLTPARAQQIVDF